jgi:1-aminocyclopropane-1-carboxylate deaminase/D-cysteine desulfhydrase-like pyridoxal-dependent ACC family enzyme
MDWSRRRFIQGLTLAGVGAGVGVSATCFAQSRASLPILPLTGDVLGLAPAFATPRTESLSLAKFFPSLIDPDAAQGPRIVNTLTGNGVSAGNVRQGQPGNAVFFEPGSKRAIIPWTPLFAREQQILQLPESLTRKLECSELLVLNESSAQHPMFGNKARKYEFLLPNLQWSGVRRTATLGAVSSNHALQFALANRMADLTGAGEPLRSELDLVLFEVPGVPTDEKRLAILQQLSKRIVLARNMVGMAGEFSYELASQRMHSDTDAIVPPGGSNELSVLGHMNAIADFAQFLESSRAWDAPPDYICVAMGSGSTVLGLVLGVRLLGWNTQVVGVADQDKSFVSRVVANQQPSLPFVEGNVNKLADKAIDWLKKIQFPGIEADSRQVLRREAFLPDSNSWNPGYGLVQKTDVAWQEELQSAGLHLDTVFTLKAWRSLVSMAQSGALKNKRVLFWNTYNSFDYTGYAQPFLSDLDHRHAQL